MFGIGANELIIILLFGFIIFGPDKLPGMAKTIGQAIARFRSAQEEMNRVIRTEVYDPNAEDPFKNPLDAISKLENQASKENRGESFTERKARYDKQRAARKAAEERKAETQAKREAEKAAKEGGEEAAEAVRAKAEAEKAERAAAEEEKKKISADELYGTKPVPKKDADAADGVEPAEEEKAEKDARPAVRKTPPKKKAAGPVDKQVEEASDVKDAPAKDGEGE